MNSGIRDMVMGLFLTKSVGSIVVAGACALVVILQWRFPWLMTTAGSSLPLRKVISRKCRWILKFVSVTKKSSLFRKAEYADVMQPPNSPVSEGQDQRG